MPNELNQASPDVSDKPLENPIPRVIQVETPTPTSDNLIVVLAANGQLTQKFDGDIDGFLVYVVPDANVTDQILVSNGNATGGSNDDILTAGHAITILAMAPYVSLRNLSANAHTVVIKAFKGWLPAYT